MVTSRSVLDVLACPDCSRPFESGRCGGCGREAALEDGIWPLLPAAGESDAIVRAFYEEQPFPDYEDLDSPRALCERAEASGFARSLHRELAAGGRVLEAGCGTGQLTNYLAWRGRCVVGLDFSAASLRTAAAFRDRFGIQGAHFVQGDVLRPPLREGVFSAVVSIGVLHHTPAPEEGVAALARRLEPGGLLVLGLYHRCGRLATRTRRALRRVAGTRAIARLDPVLARDRRNERRRRAWIRDQYEHPYETSHTVGQVRRWFERAGLELVRTVPSRHGRLAQLAWTFTLSREGGVFLAIGRRPRP